MHVRLADESICVGPHQAANSYLNIPAIMSAIELTNSEAVHPGYGFLSENYEFAKILEQNKIKFIGPSSSLIKMMGDKIEAKKIAKKYGLPVIEGSEGGVSDFNEAKKICKEIGYPILIKAAGGGGGKGMKVVTKEEEFESLFLTAKTEFIDIVKSSIKEINNIDTKIENGGGTSDGRWVAPMGSEIVELGPLNKTIHQIDEHVDIEDLSTLKEIYKKILIKVHQSV